ncbi:MAG: hypothetical protein Q9188_005245 [Gyalolechia gomerana]
MSITSDHPSIGRSSLEAIEKWVEAAISKRDIQLEPITTIPTGVATQPLDVLISGPYTGIGDAASTVIGASVFDSIISAAATETETVSAIGGSAATASNTPTSSAATGQMSTGRSSHDSPLTSSTSMDSSTMSGMATGAAGSGTPTAPDSPRSDTSGRVVYEAANINSNGIMASCPWLVSYIEVVRWVHQIAQDYPSTNHHGRFPDGHGDIAGVCLKHLSFKPFSRGR